MMRNLPVVVLFNCLTAGVSAYNDVGLDGQEGAAAELVGPEAAWTRAAKELAGDIHAVTGIAEYPDVVGTRGQFQHVRLVECERPPAAAPHVDLLDRKDLLQKV